jgi:mono/diheme cytochrome c family protein
MRAVIGTSARSFTAQGKEYETMIDGRKLRQAGIIIAFFGLTFLQLPMRADDASAKLYQTKCVVCHAADGSGSTTVGKNLQIKDLRDSEVQKQTDADLVTVVTKGKNKMPSYEKSLKAEEIKGLVAYVRELGKKK